MIISRSEADFADCTKTESSAKSQVIKLEADGRSFMKIRKSSGPRTLPWGTPHSMRHSADKQPSMRVSCFLSEI